MNQRKAGIVLSYIYTAVHGIANLLYIPILLNRIGQNEYGLYQLVGSLISYLSMTESLLSTGVLRYYCKYNSIGDEQKKENVLAISKKIYKALSFIVVIIGIICIFVFRITYESSLTKHEMSEAIIMLFILIVIIVLNLINAVYTAAITANERFVFLKILSISTTLLQPIAILLVIRKMPYAISVVVVQLSMCIFSQIAIRFYSTNKLNIKIKYHYKDEQFKRDLFALSFSILLVAIADQIFWKTDQLIIGKMLGTAAVAVYSVGSQIYLNYLPIGTAISSVFMPRLSKLLDQENNMEEVSKLFIKVGRISFIILSAVLVGFVLYGKEFISIWASTDYIDAYYVAIVIMIPLTVDVMQNMGLTVLQIKGNYGFRGKVYLSIAVLNIIATIYLVQQLGIIGAAISTSIAMAIGNGFIMNVYYAKKVGLNIKKFWKEIAAILPSTFICLLLGLLIKRINIRLALIDFCIHILLFCVAYIIIMYCLAFNEYEKQLTKGLTAKIWRIDKMKGDK